VEFRLADQELPHLFYGLQVLFFFVKRDMLAMFRKALEMKRFLLEERRVEVEQYVSEIVF
jgi:hypothetical protein